jgi:hypothetical protein
MTEEIHFGEEGGLLTCEYNSQTIRYPVPPAQGSHQKCFSKINACAELRPAEGVELSLLVQGALEADVLPGWKKVRKDCLTRSYVRIPKRILWIPLQNSKGKKNELAGVFVERDLEGNGLSTQMNVPENLDGWKEENGIYRLGELTFVPRWRYDFDNFNKKSFSCDGLAIALLTEEGAEIFARTAYDSKMPIKKFGEDITEIKKPEKRVPIFLEGSLDILFRCDSFDRGCDGYAFGVRRERK